MRVVIDPDLCEANGRCEEVAPQVFELGEMDTVQVALPHSLSEADEAAIAEAAALCPRGAIAIVDDG